MKTLEPSYADIAARLHAWLTPTFSDIMIDVGYSERWQSLQLVFRWDGFGPLLPEERFRKLLFAIPRTYYRRKLRRAVWFELAPHETIESFMKLPRSEDVAREAPRWTRLLAELGFFPALRRAVGRPIAAACTGELIATRRVLRARGLPGDHVDRACLLFIRHDAYCDCQVLRAADQLRMAAP